MASLPSEPGIHHGNPTLLRSDTIHNDFSWNPLEYAKAIYDFSKLETGVGQNFDRLAEFLAPHPGGAGPSKSQDGFITLYQLNPGSPSQKCDKRVYNIHSCEEFERLEPYRHAGPTNNLIFLKGYPSPEWLRCIGSRYGVDPEFFRRHFDFRSQSQSKSNLSTVTLPSSSWRMLELHITTLLTAEYTTRRDISSEQLRGINNSTMERYIMGLLVGDIATGDPIIRHFSTIDATHFAMEQRISISLHVDDHNWTMFLWVDSSKDVSETSAGPWLAPRSVFNAKRTPTRLHMQPIIKYKPMLALKSHRITEAPYHPNPNRPTSSTRQSASTLHLDYGRTLRPNLMACDTVYALKEVFELVTQAELQFLDMCDTRLNEFQEAHSVLDPDCLPNLKNLKKLLYRHLLQNREAYTSLNNMQHPQWPKAPEDHLQQKAAIAAEALKEDYTQLLKMNEQLHEHCTEAIGVLMNEIVISESKDARIQAARVGKLTFLAYIFVPLSFTTSFFGMNFRELGSGENFLSIWSWFVLSVPLLFFALLFFKYDLHQIKVSLWLCIDSIVALFKKE